MLNPFELLLPTSLQEALSWYDELGDACKVLAGGTDVLVEMHAGRKSYPCLLDIKMLPELQGCQYSPAEGLYLGALTTHRRLERWPVVQAVYPALYEGVSQVGSVQIRCRGTVGGNICTAAPSGDSLGPLLALNARLLVEGRGGRREIPFEEFFVGAKKTALQKGELLTHIAVPAPAPLSSSAYTKFTRRKAMDLALLGAAVSLTCAADGMTCREVRVALSTVAPTPLRARQAEEFLRGKKLTDQVMQEAGEIAAAEAKPRSSWRASAQYRHEVLKAIVPRTIARALNRVQNGAGR